MARLCPPGRFRRALDLVQEDFVTNLEELEFVACAYAKDRAVRAALGMAYADDERLAAISWLEGRNLVDRSTFLPPDAGRYVDSGMEPDLDGEVPAWLRFEPDGPALPEHGPGVVAVLIAVLAEQARSASRRVRRFGAIHETPAVPMRIVYPAKGEESGAEARTPSARG